jgi:hypothetical protein
MINPKSEIRNPKRLKDTQTTPTRVEFRVSSFEFRVSAAGGSNL